MLIYIGRRVVTLPSQRRDNIRFEKSRIVHLQFETNLIEKISTDKWPCEQDLRNDYCLESVVETESKCYLPWGLGIGAGIYYYFFLLNKLFFYIYWNSGIKVGWKVFVGTLTYLINVEDEINEEIKYARQEGNLLLHETLPGESMKSEKTLSETLCLLDTSEYLC